MALCLAAVYSRDQLMSIRTDTILGWTSTNVYWSHNLASAAEDVALASINAAADGPNRKCRQQSNVRLYQGKSQPSLETESCLQTITISCSAIDVSTKHLHHNNSSHCRRQEIHGALLTSQQPVNRRTYYYIHARSTYNRQCVLCFRSTSTPVRRHQSGIQVVSQTTRSAGWNWQVKLILRRSHTQVHRRPTVKKPHFFRHPSVELLQKTFERRLLICLLYLYYYTTHKSTPKT